MMVFESRKESKSEKLLRLYFPGTQRNLGDTLWVQNARGEDYNEPSESLRDSWSDWHRDYGGDGKLWCRCLSACNKEIVGGHVYIWDYRIGRGWRCWDNLGLFVTPICNSCNRPEQSQAFEVSIKDLMPVDKDSKLRLDFSWEDLI